MLRKRLQTAGILIVLFVLILLFSPVWLLTLVAAAIIALATWEYAQMVYPGQGRTDSLLLLGLAVLFPFAASYGSTPSLFGSLFVCLALLGLRALFRADDLKVRLEGLQNSLFGILYISFTVSHLLLIRRDCEDWKPWIFTILAAIYLGDGAAYFVGTSLGKRKLAPLLSPKKTVEGALGGLAASVLGVFLCRFLILPSLSAWEALLVGVTISVAGQLGDLLESLIKRTHDVKDSGTLLPGHGGILDRIDSILLAGPIGYYLALAL